jgi:hypothetical protein
MLVPLQIEVYHFQYGIFFITEKTCNFKKQCNMDTSIYVSSALGINK